MTCNNLPPASRHKIRRFTGFAACLLLASCSQGPEEAATPAPSLPALADVLEGSVQAMGMQDVDRLEFTADGWEACLGQPWKISEGWARWSLTGYNRVIDYGAFRSLQTAQRQAGMDPDRLGGCGAQPNANPQNQQTAVNSESGWEQQLQIYLTPAGFIRLAREYGGTVSSGAGGLTVTIDDVAAGGVNYRFVGEFGTDNLPDRITTWIDNSVYGDMAYTAEFSAYQDFDGVMFPARIVQMQGGFATLDLAVTSVIPNTGAAAEPPPREVRPFGGGQQAADRPEYEQVGDGVYAIYGAYQSVIVAFNDYLVVLDGLQNDQRARDIIRIAGDIAPGKPIGYVLTTHNHFDHASGLREFVAAGATIITHASNVAFFEQVLSVPRTLNPAETAGNGMTVKVMGVDDVYALDDGSQRVEFYKLNDSTHADDMLIAYIPAIRTIVEADLLQPWINPVFGGVGHPFLVWLADELDRVGIDYERFVPIHTPPNPPLMSKADLMTAAGRQ